MPDCGECGVELPQAARFCQNCGTRQAAPQSPRVFVRPPAPPSSGIRERAQSARNAAPTSAASVAAATTVPVQTAPSAQIVRTYPGKKNKALKDFKKEVKQLAKQGYVPISQRWVQQPRTHWQEF
jgi:hypothetical protein